MKKITFLALFIFSLSVQAQPYVIPDKPNHTSSLRLFSPDRHKHDKNHVYRNQYRVNQQMLHYWNGSGYDTVNRYFYQYTGSTLLEDKITQLYFDGNFHNSERELYYYDDYGRDTCIISLFWVEKNRGWEIMQKLTTSYNEYGYPTFIGFWGNENGQYILYFASQIDYTFDLNGLLLMVTHSYFTYGMGWDNGYRMIYEYDNNDLLTAEITQFWHDETQSWVNSTMLEYFYQNQVWDEVISSEWDEINNEWLPKEKVTNILWHNFYQQLLSYYLLWVYNGSDWEMYQQAFFTYNAYSMLTEELFHQYFNGSWVNMLRFSWNYDNFLNLVLFLNEYWDGDTWQVAEGNQYNLEYDANGNVVVEYFNSYSTDLGTWIPVHKLENWYDNITAIPDANQQVNVSVYPNPAHDLLFIDFDRAAASVTTYTIVDFQGRVIQKGIIPAGSSVASIPVNDLKSGLYVLTVFSKGLTGNFKFQKK